MNNINYTSVSYEFLMLNKSKLVNETEIKSLVDKKIANLKCGDVVIMSSMEKTPHNEKNFYADAVFNLVLNASDVNQNDTQDKYLCELVKSANGLDCIPVEISKLLYEKSQSLDFVKSYSELYTEKFSVYAKTFKGIELDIKDHAKHLPNAELNVELLIQNKAKLYYFFMDPADKTKKEANFYVWINVGKISKKQYYLLSEIEDMDEVLDDEDDDDEEEDSEQAMLDQTAEIREQLIEMTIEEPSTAERDPEIEEFSEKFRQIYENQFRSYLKTLARNETIYATSMPAKKYCKETYDDDAMNSTTLLFYFDGLELDEHGNINAVKATTFDKTETCHFHPYLCRQYGPYYKTMLLCCLYNVGRKSDSMAENFFLDLPVDLYNQIDMD